MFFSDSALFESCVIIRNLSVLFVNKKLAFAGQLCVIIVGCKLELTEGEGDRDQAFDIENQPHSFVFASKNWMTTEDRLLMLIHGSGVVRAGQWARRYRSLSR